MLHLIFAGKLLRMAGPFLTTRFRRKAAFGWADLCPKCDNHEELGRLEERELVAGAMVRIRLEQGRLVLSLLLYGLVKTYHIITPTYTDVYFNVFGNPTTAVSFQPPHRNPYPITMLNTLWELDFDHMLVSFSSLMVHVQQFTVPLPSFRSV